MIPVCAGFRSESIDVTLTSWACPGTHGQPVGIFCAAATTITGALSGDAAETTWVLAANVVHWLSFKTINTTSATKNGYRVLYAR
jgi:hypothetical protein